MAGRRATMFDTCSRKLGEEKAATETLLTSVHEALKIASTAHLADERASQTQLLYLESLEVQVTLCEAWLDPVTVHKRLIAQ
eukprot:7298218-Pyramimonas_sp.AAC.1